MVVKYSLIVTVTLFKKVKADPKLRTGQDHFSLYTV